jgi:hypothetical protein
MAGEIVFPAVVFVGCWIKLRWSGVEGVMLKEFEVAPVSAGLLVAANV